MEFNKFELAEGQYATKVKQISIPYTNRLTDWDDFEEYAESDCSTSLVDYNTGLISECVKLVDFDEVFMTYAFNDVIEITVGERRLFGWEDRLKFAQNEGFVDYEDFFEYYYKKIEEGHGKFSGLTLYVSNDNIDRYGND